MRLDFADLCFGLIVRGKEAFAWKARRLVEKPGLYRDNMNSVPQWKVEYGVVSTVVNLVLKGRPVR